ncbi:armadillo-type protein [Truncatella angustata]|uniref:Armadillo-type protein n=1 Tax=Truncatella angustata TaxID=152316 RepID=A0A9P8RIF1_9PEZI|nr:armadillo-type protein [Truncatella angustata]KAH6644923.1 armadillo-type protein [Truncatella angustata]
MTPEDVQKLFERSTQPVQPLRAGSTTDDEDDEVSLSDGERSRRVEQLKQVLSTLGMLVDSESVQLDALAQKVGDGSRDASWRLPLGQSGVLDFFLELVGRTGLRQATTIHALRVIGNSCADTDENRARVVASNCMPKIVNLLNDDSILGFVIPVLFNICVDYEPAQAAAYKAGINPELVTLISGPRKPTADALMNIICKLLALVANQESEANLVHPATPFILLKLAINPQSLADLEDFLGQVSVALTYLSNAAFQETFLQTPNAIPLFLEAFSKSCTNFDINAADSEDASRLKKVNSIFTQALADISSSPQFATACQIGGAEMQTLERWIGSPYSELQSAACLTIGNIARSDDICIALVQQSAIHRSLMAILSDRSKADAQLLHSTLSFLKNLAIPASNKAILGDAGLFESHVLPRLWALDAQVQVQFTAVSLTRLLLVSSPENVKRITATLSADPSSPAADRTHLKTLIDLFLRSDQEPTKTEAARAVAAVLRVLHSSPDASTLLPNLTGDLSKVSSPSQDGPGISPSPALEAFYASHDTLTDTLVYLGTQQKFPVLRSDLWFVMALMSRSAVGADVVARCLQNVELLRALLQTITGHDMIAGLIAGAVQEETAIVSGIPGGLEPQQVDPARKAGMARVDRENGLVLVAELLQRCPDRLTLLPQETYREILQTGGEQVLSDRDGNRVDTTT